MSVKPKYPVFITNEQQEGLNRTCTYEGHEPHSRATNTVAVSRFTFNTGKVVLACASCSVTIRIKYPNKRPPTEDNPRLDMDRQ